MHCVRGVVCMVQPRRYAFTPCGHRCVCHLCAVGITHMERRCPICRAQAGAEELLMESCPFFFPKKLSCFWDHLAIPVACRWCASWELWTHEDHEARARPACLYGSTSWVWLTSFPQTMYCISPGRLFGRAVMKQAKVWTLLFLGPWQVSCVTLSKIIHVNLYRRQFRNWQKRQESARIQLASLLWDFVFSSLYYQGSCQEFCGELASPEWQGLQMNLTLPGNLTLQRRMVRSEFLACCDWRCRCEKWRLYLSNIACNELSTCTRQHNLCRLEWRGCLWIDGFSPKSQRVQLVS